VVFVGSWNAVDANTSGLNFKELGTHPDPSCLFAVAQQLVQQLTAKKTNLFRLAVKPSKENLIPRKNHAMRKVSKCLGCMTNKFFSISKLNFRKFQHFQLNFVKCFGTTSSWILNKLAFT
jgi:hypothetical protein